MTDSYDETHDAMREAIGIGQLYRLLLPQHREVRSDGAEGIACWFIDTDYNEESFFVRHAYFLSANDPCSVLKTTLKAEINPEAWATLNSDTSRPFDKPRSGRIAVKVINHLGDEVMKVFKV
jgi:adenine-specific DNA-methyltransferase